VWYYPIISIASGHSPDDADYSSRWKAVKIHFAKAILATEYRSYLRRANGERGVVAEGAAFFRPTRYSIVKSGKYRP